MCSILCCCRQMHNGSSVWRWNSSWIWIQNLISDTIFEECLWMWLVNLHVSWSCVCRAEICIWHGLFWVKIWAPQDRVAGRKNQTSACLYKYIRIHAIFSEWLKGLFSYILEWCSAEMCFFFARNKTDNKQELHRFGNKIKRWNFHRRAAKKYQIGMNKTIDKKRERRIQEKKKTKKLSIIMKHTLLLLLYFGGVSAWLQLLAQFCQL